jgi:hypothetical protein
VSTLSYRVPRVGLLPTVRLRTRDIEIGGRAHEETVERRRRQCSGLRVHEVPGSHRDLPSRDNAPAVMSVLTRCWFGGTN